MTSQVLEQSASVVAEPRGGTNLLFVRLATDAAGVEAQASVSAVGAPTELNQIARGIVLEFGEALDRLAE